MGKVKPRSTEKGGLVQKLNVSSSGSSHVPSAPVYYPNEEEFKDPLKFIDKIRPEAEQYGICKIVPPKSWSPPFALDLDKFSFPTKTQAIHQLQARPASCDSKTFELEYNRFLEVHCGKKLKKKVVFEGEELDLCKLFNAVKRFGGYDKVAKAKKWGEVSRFLKVGMKISECAKHVLCQLYREHLYDYEKKYCSKLNREIKNCKRGVQEDKKSGSEGSCLKRRRKNGIAKKIMVCDELTEDSDLDQICCEQCKSGLHGEVMLLCDRCNKGWHIYCLSPPFKQIPPGNWYCFECLNSDKDSFGFVPGKCYSVEAFRRIADRAKKKWFGLTSTSRVQLEKKFWEIVDGLAGEVEVLYGSDLDTSVYGSGFPRAGDQRPESVDLNLWDKYCRSPWNLNNLPKLAGSVLQAVNHNITGVMVPWLYVGMLFSSFCWHFEDHCFYSMNYLHWGEPKCWYSIPGEVSSAFEKVMRNCLPDLFEAQPDLLFQLVTMLNPSVLQEYGVPVYTVQQEPGNFVITFPRSYHAGFNFGLNCAEAVNFAPADWLPHGGYGAKLYQMYHKTAVISHEELLCVVAKGELDGQASLHLKRELLRIYNREKTCRERLWRGGIVKSSQMPPRKCPEYVGREEDLACVICKQYLYLSAVSCRCRPSAFVCLEHWEHICECKPSRLRLLYRHTLAELYDLVLRVDDCGFKEKSQGNLQGPIFSQELNSLTKKVKGSHISLMQLAEQWLSRSCELFKNQSSSDAFCTVLKEAEQFLWAGCEMDPVRKMVNDLVTAKKWVEGIRDCISRLDNWSSDCDLEKVHVESIVELLNTDPLPYKEPGLLKLKEHAEKARQLTEEINSALSSYLNVTELEALFKRATDFPIKLKEHEKLSEKLSAAKVWLKDADKCLSEQSFAAISLDVLYKLKFQIMELQVQMPETDILLDLLTRAELCQSQCKDILETLTSIKNVEVVLEEFSNFSVYVPELMLLKQHLTDATSWIDRCNSVLVNVHEREDHDSVIDELNFLLKDRLSLRIKVNEVYFLESELRKVCCRAKALKASKTVVPLIFIQELMREAVLLQIQDEMIFVNISGVLATALLWEEKAINVLADGAQMSEFEDIIRVSEDIHVTLPSLDRVKDAVVVAKFWLKNSEPFLAAHSSTLNDSYSLLKHAALKELVLQSESLGIFLDEKNVLKKLLSSCEQWERVALSEMQDAESILNKSCYHDGKNKDLIFEIENVVNRMGSTVQYGFSLGFDFPMIPKLQNACSMLQWCIRALSLCIVFPTLEDVEVLLQAATNHYDAALPATLLSSLTDGLKWIKKALEVSLPSSMEHYKLSDAEEVLAQYESRNLSFPLIVDQLKLAIRRHNSWRNQADQFFSLSSEEQSWSAIFELKERGKASAFNCIELDMVLAKVRKVENWKEKCANVIGRLVDDRCSLLGALQKIKKSLDISSRVYGKEGSTNLLVCCISCYGDQELLTCSTCKDCYHSKCLEPELVDVTNTELPVCPYCQLLSNMITTFGKVSGLVRFGGTRPDSKLLTELLSEAEGFDGIEEKDALQQVVEQACEYTSYMMEIIGSALLYMDKDLKFLFEKLLTALKAIAAACINDHDIAVDFELALARYSWKVRIDKLLLGIQKPTMQQIHQCIKEGLAITIPPEDYFLLELTKLKHLGLQWADRAKKVAADNGALALDKVFELITEIESLPLYLEKELKLLQARSKLYCICRKPYDNRAKVACNQCDEWYHIDCIKLLYPRKAYMCPACDPQYEEFSKRQIDHERLASNKLVEPKTPSRLHANLMKPRRNLNGTEYGKKIILRKANDVHSGTSSIEILGWRNRKPFRRTTKRRTEMESLFPNFQIHP